MTGIEIARGATFSLVSHGNGWAYTFYRRPLIDTPLDDCPGVWMQDDDALNFESEREALERVHPDWTLDRVMQELWDLFDCDSQAEIA